jgi:hypothetical protein
VRVGRADRRRAPDHRAGGAGHDRGAARGPSPPYRRRRASTEGQDWPACRPDGDGGRRAEVGRRWLGGWGRQAGLVLDCVLAVHGPHLSQAMVDLDSGGWLATEEFPPRLGGQQFLAGRVTPLLQHSVIRSEPGWPGGVPTSDAGRLSTLQLVKTACDESSRTEGGLLEDQVSPDKPSIQVGMGQRFRRGSRSRRAGMVARSPGWPRPAAAVSRRMAGLGRRGAVAASVPRPPARCRGRGVPGRRGW